MTNENGKEQHQQQARDQGGHAGMGGHGGQQSGGMGGQNGGDLHDVGSGQSGMTGRGGMGGNDNDHRKDSGDNQQAAQPGNEQRDEAGDDIAEVQQSAPREGMGRHRHPGRAHEQALDETEAADLGHHDGAAADAEKNQGGDV